MWRRALMVGGNLLGAQHSCALGQDCALAALERAADLAAKVADVAAAAPPAHIEHHIPLGATRDVYAREVAKLAGCIVFDPETMLVEMLDSFTYKEYADQGLCPRCPEHAKSAVGRVACEACLERARRLYKEYADHGLCPRCPEHAKSAVGHVACEACLERARWLYKCGNPQCGRPPISGLYPSPAGDGRSGPCMRCHTTQSQHWYAGTSKAPIICRACYQESRKKKNKGRYS
ncbi:MAG: hypothetical protein J3K34DRAFT_465248 [Monoraphidium minutum]|nr:MAG: hypothetical protein J3K34DRAFT_465248 [Monoraphidium minutum]